MTCKEIARLIEWLKSKGHTPDEIIACIEYNSPGIFPLTSTA